MCWHNATLLDSLFDELCMEKNKRIVRYFTPRSVELSIYEFREFTSNTHKECLHQKHDKQAGIPNSLQVHSLG